MAQAEQATQGNVPVAAVHPIGTRDGTLAKDAKLVNLFSEPWEEGNSATKRPGTVLVQQNPAALAQGQFQVNGVSYAISGDIIYRTGTGASFAIPTVTVSNQQYQCLSDSPLGTSLLKSASGLWKFDGTTVTKVTDVNYPATTVFGIAYLDGGYYVMDNSGNVRGSAFQNPLSWPALNFIGDTSLGAAVAVNRHLNYIVAIYASGMQFYYDAGNATGSPLSVVSNASWKTGSAVGDSLVEFADDTFLLSKGLQKGASVMMVTGLSLTIISNPYIERIIARDNLSEVHAFGIRTAGHGFYVLTLVNTGVTLAFDTGMKDWAVWTGVVGGVEQYFPAFNYLNSGTQDLLQNRSTGAVIAMDPTVYTDVTGGIPCLIRTQPHSWGTMARKFLPAIYLLADTIASTVSIRYSDDDYTSYSTYRTVSLATVRKMLQRCGSSRRRSWDILHNDNTPFRLYSMEVEAERGAG